MRSILSEYDFVSVADLYKMVGKEAEWAAQKWGWSSISGAHIEKLRRGGYEIILPEPEKI